MLINAMKYHKLPRHHTHTWAVSYNPGHLSRVIPLLSVAPHFDLPYKVEYVPQESITFIGGTLRPFCCSALQLSREPLPSSGVQRFIPQLLNSLTLRCEKLCNCRKVYRTVEVESEGHVFIFRCVSRGVTFVFHQFIHLEEKHFVSCANKHKAAGYVLVLVSVN